MSVTSAIMVLPDQDNAVSAEPVSPAASTASFPDHRARRISAAISSGDESSFAELYDGYHARLHRLAMVLTHGDELVARDAVQVTMLTAAGKLRALESESHLWNWLARVLRQHLARNWRQQQHAPVWLDLTELPELAAKGSDSALEDQLETALLQLTPEARQILEWFYFDGLSHMVIAERLATSAKAVSSRLERARAELRSLVKRKGVDVSR